MNHIKTPTNLGLIWLGLMVLLAGTVTLGQMQRGGRRRLARGVLWTILAGYLAAFAWLTVLQRSPMANRRMLLQPFRSYAIAFSLEGGLHVLNMENARQVILNIWVMMPLGFLLPPLLERFRGRYAMTALAGLLLTVLVECSQLVLQRGYFEIDDLINNTLGSVLGLAMYWLAERIVLRVRTGCRK